MLEHARRPLTFHLVMDTEAVVIGIWHNSDLLCILLYGNMRFSQYKHEIRKPNASLEAPRKARQRLTRSPSKTLLGRARMRPKGYRFPPWPGET